MPEISQTEREFLLQKHELTNRLRQEYQKQYSNPYRHGLGTGGGVFDPAIARHQAMRVSLYEHFKPTMKPFFTTFVPIVSAIVFAGYLVTTERARREHKFRTGQVAYKDRLFKFI